MMRKGGLIVASSNQLLRPSSTELRERAMRSESPLPVRPHRMQNPSPLHSLASRCDIPMHHSNTTSILCAHTAAPQPPRRLIRNMLLQNTLNLVFLLHDTTAVTLSANVCISISPTVQLDEYERTREPCRVLCLFQFFVLCCFVSYICMS